MNDVLTPLTKITVRTFTFLMFILAIETLVSYVYPSETGWRYWVLVVFIEMNIPLVAILGVAVAIAIGYPLTFWTHRSKVLMKSSVIRFTIDGLNILFFYIFSIFQLLWAKDAGYISFGLMIGGMFVSLLITTSWAWLVKCQQLQEEELLQVELLVPVNDEIKVEKIEKIENF